MSPLVVIGLITYQRPKMLSSALLSLSKLIAPKDVSIFVVVVDNDKKATARTIVDSYANILSYPMHYFMENRQGIPFARNKVVKEAINLGASEIVFFDDDELVNPDWLCELYCAYKKYGCDIVTGPVITKYPDKTPRWAIKGKFYERERFKTGSDRHYAVTGNILFSMKWFIEKNLRFNEQLALTGGSDTYLTKLIVQKGGEIKWADNAIVFESVPLSRLCINWLLKRKYRIKLTEIKCSIEHNGLIHTYFFSSLSFIKNLCLGILYALLALLSGFHSLVRALIFFTNSFAIVSALIFNHHYEEYNTIHGE